MGFIEAGLHSHPNAHLDLDSHGRAMKFHVSLPFLEDKVALMYLYSGATVWAEATARGRRGQAWKDRDAWF